MARPACANPANIHHVVTPCPEIPSGRYCHRECVCGEIVSGLGPNACDPEHEPHPGGCTCEVTPVACIDCDVEFIPVDEDKSCPSCVARDSA